MYVYFPGRKDVAIELYKKGICELQKGIAVEIKGQGQYSLSRLKISELKGQASRLVLLMGSNFKVSLLCPQL